MKEIVKFYVANAIKIDTITDNRRFYKGNSLQYSMKKVTIKKEIEYWVETCKKCGKKITGTSESQTKHNMKIHKMSKECNNEK